MLVRPRPSTQAQDARGAHGALLALHVLLRILGHVLPRLLLVHQGGLLRLVAP